MIILEPVLIRLFFDSLRPFIYAQAKQDGRPKDTCEQAIKKAITAEAKAALNLLFLVWKIDVCCFWGHQYSLKANKHTKKKIFQQNSHHPPQRSRNTKTSNRP